MDKFQVNDRIAKNPYSKHENRKEIFMKTVTDTIIKVAKPVILNSPFLLSAYRGIRHIGSMPSRVSRIIRARSLYYRDLKTFRCQEESTVKRFAFSETHSCMKERFMSNGAAKGHYFHQDLLVARRIHLNNPFIYIDVGYRIDGFVALCH